MWGDESVLDGAERGVDEWQAGIEQRAAQGAALARAVKGLSVTVRSRDALVEVTVGPSGALTGLRLDEQVRRHSAARLAEQIMVMLRTAQDRLTEQVRAAAAQTVGLDSETGRAIIASYVDRLTRGERDDHAGG